MAPPLCNRRPLGRWAQASGRYEAPAVDATGAGRRLGGRRGEEGRRGHGGGHRPGHHLLLVRGHGRAEGQCLGPWWGGRACGATGDAGKRLQGPGGRREEQKGMRGGGGDVEAEAPPDCSVPPNPSVGVFKNGRVEIIANDQGNRITPSYVAFTPEGERLIGDAAKNQLTSNPENTVFDAKRLIGRTWNDPSVQQDIKYLPFKVGPECRGWGGWRGGPTVLASKGICSQYPHGRIGV